MPRILGLVVAAVTALLLAAPTAAPAQAGTASRDHATTTDRAADRALPQRPVTIDINVTKRTTRGVWVKISGKARAWRGEPVLLQKKRAGVFRTIDRDRTNARGVYSFRKFLKVGTHRFRVKVPKGNGYARTYSRVTGGTVS